MGFPTKKTSAKLLTATMDKLRWSVQDLAGETGWSVSAIHAWIRDGKMPYSNKLSCEALLMKKKIDPDEPVIRAFVKVPQHRYGDFSRMVEMLEATHQKLE